MRSALVRWASVVAAPLAALLVAGCGGSGLSRNVVAKVGGTTESLQPHRVPTRVLDEFAACMRAEGVKKFPQPEHGGFKLGPAHVNNKSPRYKAASGKCSIIIARSA